MNPEHLFAQAEHLLDGMIGAGRQADKRRAVSTAYYAVFHSVAHAVAHQVVGDNHAGTPQYASVWRAVRHDAIAKLCEELPKSPPRGTYRPFWPDGGFGADLRAFAAALPTLRRARENADYDPRFRLTVAQARDWLSRSREAVALFDAGRRQHNVFAVLLLTRF